MINTILKHKNQFWLLEKRQLKLHQQLRQVDLRRLVSGGFGFVLPRIYSLDVLNLLIEKKYLGTYQTTLEFLAQ